MSGSDDKYWFEGPSIICWGLWPQRLRSNVNGQTDNHCWHMWQTQHTKLVMLQVNLGPHVSWHCVAQGKHYMQAGDAFTWNTVCITSLCVTIDGSLEVAQGTGSTSVSFHASLAQRCTVVNQLRSRLNRMYSGSIEWLRTIDYVRLSFSAENVT